MITVTITQSGNCAASSNRAAKPAQGLRSASQGGCSGLQYEMSLVSETGRWIVATGRRRVFVDSDADYLRRDFDYRDGLTGAVFTSRIQMRPGLAVRTVFEAARPA